MARGQKRLSCEALERLAGALGMSAEAVKLRAGVVPDDLLARIQQDPEGFMRWGRGL